MIRVIRRRRVRADGEGLPNNSTQRTALRCPPLNRNVIALKER